MTYDTKTYKPEETTVIRIRRETLARLRDYKAPEAPFVTDDDILNAMMDTFVDITALMETQWGRAEDVHRQNENAKNLKAKEPERGFTGGLGALFV